MRKLYVLLALIVLTSLAIGCASPTPTPVPPTAVPPKPTVAPTAVPPTATAVPPSPTPDPLAGASAEFKVVWKAANDFVKNVPKQVMPEDAYKAITDKKDLWILDVRKPDDATAKGVISGTKLVVFWTDLQKPENLAKLPKDKEIWVYCNTGNTSQSAAAVLNMLGYKATIIPYAIMSWTKDLKVLPDDQRFSPAIVGDWKVEKDIVKPTKVNAFPEIKTGGKDNAEIVRLAVDDAMKRVKVTTSDAKTIWANIASGDPTKVPFVIDLRKAEDYAKGHIPGAVNFTAADLLKPENLKFLPPDKPVVVVDYVATESQMIAMVLRTLGYDASSMRWGMMIWSKDDSLLGSFKRYSDATQKDYPVVPWKP